MVYPHQGARSSLWRGIFNGRMNLHHWLGLLYSERVKEEQEEREVVGLEHPKSLLSFERVVCLRSGKGTVGLIVAV